MEQNSFPITNEYEDIRLSRTEMFRRFGWSIMLFGAIVIAGFTMLLFAMYRNLYAMTTDSAYRNAEARVVRYAQDINEYIGGAVFSLDDICVHVNRMLAAGAKNPEIIAYIEDETDMIEVTLLDESDGVYGYVNGEFVSGAGWVPDEDYDATERPWYIGAIEADGDVAYISPYVDESSGDIMMTVAKLLDDKKSVIAIDLGLDHLQYFTENISEYDAYVSSGILNLNGARGDYRGASYAMVVDANGQIILHSDRSRIGESTLGGFDFADADFFRHMLTSNDRVNYVFGKTKGAAPVMVYEKLRFGWNVIDVYDYSYYVNLIRNMSIGFFSGGMLFIFVVLSIFYSMAKSRVQVEKSRIRLEETETLRKAKAMAEDASRAKSDFLANMSHEIRTPINTVLGMNEMILRETGEENIRGYAGSIQTAGQTLLGLINDILDFSRIEAGKMELIPVEYELSSVLNDMVQMIHPRLEEKGLEFYANFDKNMPKTLFGDEMRVKQIVTNILTNAAKYTKKGSVTFCVGFERIPDEPDAALIEVSVKDTGIGIRKEDIPRLFSEFERIEEKRNRNIEGTGLGLSITQAILSMMDSSLEVESVYGEGSTFSFALRQTVVNWEAMGDYKEAYRSHVNSVRRYRTGFTAEDARILVVDDNPMNIAVFLNLIKQTKITADTALSGDEGIRLFTLRSYDCVFLDHMMPQKDGIETLKEMRALAREDNVGVPMICLTANAISGAREKYLKAGFDDYLSKPIDTARLENVLLTYLPQEKISILDLNEEELAEEALPEELERLKNTVVDVNAGLINSGSPEALTELLEIFFHSREKVVDELGSYFAEGDWKSYTIRVHAMKSSLRVIGVTELGEEAQKLEDAGKTEDILYIRGHHDGFIREYEKTARLVEDCFPAPSEGQKPSGPLLSEEETIRVLGEIRDAADDMDSDRLDEIFTRYANNRIPERFAGVWMQLKAAADEFDYMGIEKLCGRITEIQEDFK